MSTADARKRTFLVSWLRALVTPDPKAADHWRIFVRGLWASSMACTLCGSQTIRPSRHSFGPLVSLFGSTYRCEKCGHRFLLPDRLTDPEASRRGRALILPGLIWAAVGFAISVFRYPAWALVGVDPDRPLASDAPLALLLFWVLLGFSLAGSAVLAFTKRTQRRPLLGLAGVFALLSLVVWRYGDALAIYGPGAEAPVLVGAQYPMTATVGGLGATSRGAGATPQPGVDVDRMDELIGRLTQASGGQAPARATSGVGQESDEEIRASAAAALADLGPQAKPAIPGLIRALKDPSVHLRTKSAFALGEIDSQGGASVPFLREALHDTDRFVCFEAARALLKLNPLSKEPLPILREALKDSSGTLRVQAAEALLKSDSSAREALAALAADLKDEDLFVRLEAAQALGRLGATGKEAVPALLEAFKGQDEVLRAAAANALGNMGPQAQEAIPTLTEALKEPQLRIRTAAAQALEKISRTPAH